MGHLLALDVPDSFLPAPNESVEAQNRILDNGGIGFIALPCDLKDHWRDFNRRNPLIGLEVFNLSAIARSKINIPAMLLIWFRHNSKKRQRAYNLVAARPSREIRLWDSMMAPDSPGGPYNPVVGIGSVDAHAVMKFGGMTLNLPTYEDVFKTLRTHIVLDKPLIGARRGREAGGVSKDDSASDIAAVHEAFAKGRMYISYDNYADPSGFLFYALVSGKDGTSVREICMGEEILFNSGCIRLRVTLPAAKSFVRIYRDGKCIASSRGLFLEYQVDRPGVYRVEAFLYSCRIGDIHFGGRPWIFSNPIYIQPEISSEKPAQKRAIPVVERVKD
jgi:hypothetical protein